MAMRWKLLVAAGISMISVTFAAEAVAASTNTIAVGSPITLQARILVTVPIRIVCDPLPNTPGSSYVQVQVQQANGKLLSSATGSVGTLPGFYSGPVFLTCDSTTVNVVKVPVVGGPFHHGGAVVTASFEYASGIPCTFFPNCMNFTNTETAATPPTLVSIRG
jgi:hypothetical protein